jgi:prolyl oligopeptidase
MTGFDPRPTVEHPDDDPYLWLEEIDSPRLLNWLEAQNAATLRRFDNATVAADRRTLKAIFDRPDNIPLPNRRGGRLFNPWRDAANPRGLWRTTTLESYLSATPEWDVLIDVDALAAEEGEDWVWRGGATLPRTLDRAIVHLSRGRSDAQVLREFDLNAKTFVADRFNLPEAKGGASWLDRDTLLLFSPLGDGMATRGGFARTIRLWRRGENPLQAPVLFETSEDSFGVWAHPDPDERQERIWFVEKPGMIETHSWIGDRGGPRTRLDLPSDCWHQTARGWLAVKPRNAWQVEGQTHAADSVLVIALAAFLSGARNFTTVFEPGERRALQSFFWCGGRLILPIFDNLKPVFEIITPNDGGYSRETISGLPPLGSTYVFPFDVHPEESKGDLLGFTNDPVTPPSLFLLKPGKAPALMKRAPESFDPTGLVMTRHEATSATAFASPMCRSARRGRPAAPMCICTATEASVPPCHHSTTRRSGNSGSSVAAPA